MKDTRLNFIIETLEPPKGKKLWYGGATVIGCLNGVAAGEALWKPSQKRHSIWELTLHIAYWKYAVRNKLVGGEPGTFPRSPSNWPKVPEDAGEKEWKEDKKLLNKEHKLLVEAVKNFNASKMDELVPGSKKYTYADILMGIVTHDIYHTGQIILMKRLYNSRS